MNATGPWLGAALLLVANLAFADKLSITDSKAFVDCMSSDYVGAGPNTHRMGCIKVEIKKYQTELSDVTISTHHLSNEWRSIQFDGSNNSDIIRLFKNRFQNINSQMLRDFNKIISQ